MASEFDEQYKKLNDAQRTAVDQTEGPVLVIAGPGTGKTQLLSMRVANIMRTTDADASNILCLTFTNKAAVNMRDRLHRLIGMQANKVTVKTFHGFAAELMANNPDYFWNGAKLSTAPDALQLEIVQTILAKLPLSNPLSIRFAGQYTGVDDTLKALRLAKEAGLTPEKLRAIISINLAYIDTIEAELVEILSTTLRANKIPELRSQIEELPEQGIDASVAPLLSLTAVIREGLDNAIQLDEGTNKTKNVGKWKSRWVQTQAGTKGMFDERRRNQWWLAFCDVYELYRDAIHARGYYDYSDMLLEVITQLEQHDDLRATVQERYQYVLIDEFQDSNAAQLRLAHLVADHHASEGLPNLMAVGDDDQSIFGFNGAELNNMLFFDRNYAQTKRIVLTNNYRSSQAILDTSEKIIEQAEDRLVNRLPGLTKKLSAQNSPAEMGEIVHIAYPTREQQLSEVARSIKLRYDNTNQGIAVLARGHDSLRTLSSILIEQNVPIKYEQQSNILEHEIVVLIITLCETLHAISNGDKEVADQKIARLVRYSVWGFDAESIWQIAISNYYKPDWLESLCNSDIAAHKQFGEWLRWLAAESTHQPLHATLEQLLGLSASTHMTSPLREYYLAHGEVTNSYLQCLSAVRLLRELVNEFSSTANANLADFIAFVAINNDNGRGIADESAFVSQDRCVDLLTVHKAKGLEYDAVYVIDVVEDNWKPRSAGRKPPANLPLQPPGELDDDYIRLLYVAATRAKHTLIIGSYLHGYDGSDTLPSPFIREAIPENTAHESELTVPLVDVLEENLRWPRLTNATEQQLLKSRLENYKLSATQLLTFLDVTQGGPAYFFERHILRLPEGRSPQQGYGSAIHSAMQLAQKLTNQGTIDTDKIVTWYERSLQTEHLLPSDYEKYLEHGKNVLDRLFNELNFTLQKGGLAEQFLSDIKIGDATLSGVLDRLDVTGDRALISDYKTGQPLHSFSTRDQNKAIKAWRHRSQLIFYALMLQQSGNYSAISAQMIYVEAEQASDITRAYQPTPEDLERMQQLITAVWNKIIKLDMPDTSKYPATIQGITDFENDLLNGTH